MRRWRWQRLAGPGWQRQAQPEPRGFPLASGCPSRAEAQLGGRRSGGTGGCHDISLPAPPGLFPCRESGLFKHPAHPRSLRSKGAELLKDLLAMEAIIYLNAAFCERHRARCPHSKALNWECSKAETLLKAYDAAWKAAVLAM